MTPMIATIGGLALWLLYAWLAAVIGAGWLAARKGYRRNLGMSTGLLLSVVGLLVWAIMPSRERLQRLRRTGRG